MNTFEGRIFTLLSETNTTDFIRQMFPFLCPQQISAAASYYMALPTPLDQSITIMGEGLYAPLIPNTVGHC